MIKFSVNWTPRAQKQLKKLDKTTAEMILRWVYKNLDGCENPRLHGKSLTADRIGQWRYRIGDYRLICEIEDKQVVILVLEVGHRKYIYD